MVEKIPFQSIRFLILQELIFSKVSCEPSRVVQID